jgi:hypothetical protein
MRIPKPPSERESFYLEIIQKCLVSRDERRPDYASLRSFYLFGCGPEDPPAIFNKIYPHLDQLTSFLYSAETTRFSINLGASVPEQEHRKIPVLTQALNDEWLNSNCDQVFSSAITWSLCYNSTFIKLIYNNGIHPYMVEPGAMGVLREDSPYLDRQEAMVQTYYITKSELLSRLYSHPKREKILDRITASYNPPITDTPNGVDRIVLSSSDPNMMGNVNMGLDGFNRYKSQVAEDTVEMKELWLWNDETMDYQVVTIASPDIVIYDRPGESVFLKGELPFIQVCPNPQYDYFWGQSECQRLIYLQQMRNNRMTEILDLLSKQVAPPTALMGFSGILDEKNFALNRAGGLLSTDMPNAKVEKLAPTIPSDLYESLNQIDRMFEEVSGIGNVLQGKGESGVRSAGHASQLARLGSSRAKKRALIVEDALEKVATLYLKIMQAYDDTHFKDTEKVPFVAEQFTKDFTVKVDAHSNSPIFTEDLRALAFNLFKAQAIDKESLLDLLEPPMKQELKDRLKRMEEKQAAAAAQQPPQPPGKGGKPDLKAVGGE